MDRRLTMTDERLRAARPEVVDGMRTASAPQPQAMSISRRLAEGRLADGGPDAEMAPATMLDLQRAVGNRTAVAVARRTPAARVSAGPAGVVQRRGGRNKKKKGRGSGGQQRNQQGPPPQIVTPPTPQPVQQPGFWGTVGSYVGSIGSSLWGSTTTGTEGEGNVDGGDVLKGGLGHTTESELGGEKEPEEAPKDVLTQLMNVPRVAIKLEKDLGGGVKTSGSGSVSREGAAGKAKIEWNGAMHESDSGPVKLLGDSLTGKGTFFAGMKSGGELEGKAGFDEQGGLSLGSKGKLSAFAGVEMKGETEVVIEVGGHQTKMKGALGFTMGIGGELSYWLTFEGGKLTWGTKGKGSLGAGVSWEYQLELPVASVTTSMWSWLAAGVSGLGGGLQTAADYLSYLGFLE